LKQHRDAWPFLDPVDEAIAPNYFRIVKTPMYLQLMEDKFDNREYLTVEELKEDFQQIVDNCRAYNGPNSGK